MDVILGSENKDKSKILLDVLKELQLDVKVKGIQVDSGVISQPLDKESIKKGAINRARDARKKVSSGDFWFGLEGGINNYGDNYYLVTFACLIEESGREFIGEGEEVQLPITRITPFQQAIQNSYAEYLKVFGKLGYRRKVSAIATNKDGDFLIVQLDSYGENDWNFPGGGIEQGETPNKAILRELEEELGSRNFEVIKVAKHISQYEWPNFVIAERLKKDGRTWRGQQVKYISMRYKGGKKEFKLDTEEVRKIKWVDFEELKSHFNFPNQWKEAEKAISGFNLKDL